MAIAKLDYNLTVSPTQLTYTPGGDPATFRVEVSNLAPRRVAIWLEIRAAGISVPPDRRWFSISPDTGVKIPPWDATTFTVAIIDNPKPNYAGQVNLSVRAISPQIDIAPPPKVLRLEIEGSPIEPLQLSLAKASIPTPAGAATTIAVTAYNPNRLPLRDTLLCRQLDGAWLPRGAERPIQVEGRSSTEIAFPIQVPPSPLAISQNYPFEIVTQRSPVPASVSGHLAIAPEGEILSACAKPKQVLPRRRERPARVLDTAIYTIAFHNHSNLYQIVTATLAYDRPESRDRAWERAALDDETLPPQLEVALPQRELPPGQETELSLVVRRIRPRWGWRRRYALTATSILSSPGVPLQPAQHALELEVLPLVPFALQVLGALVLLALLTLLPVAFWRQQVRLRHHTAAVTTVQFDGGGGSAISGSQDTTLRQWQVRGRRLAFLGIANPEPTTATTANPASSSGLSTDTSAIRVVRYRREDNSWAAVGYENGDIQLWNLPGRFSRPSFAAQLAQGAAIANPPACEVASSSDRATAPAAPTGNPAPVTRFLSDRVLDLAFLPQQATLLSAHGSGTLYRWQLQLDGRNDALLLDPQLQPIPIQDASGRPICGAIQAIAPFINGGNQYVAVGGQRNRLDLIDLDETDPTASLTRLTYPLGDRLPPDSSFISTLATATEHPQLLALGDNQGGLALWSLPQCLSDRRCAPTSTDLEAHNGQPIPAIALTADGCYLASGGLDGQVLLWPLSYDSRGLASFSPPRQIRPPAASEIAAVDIFRADARLLILSGSSDRQVRLHRLSIDPRGCS